MWSFILVIPNDPLQSIVMTEATSFRLSNFSGDQLTKFFGVTAFLLMQYSVEEPC